MSARRSAYPRPESRGSDMLRRASAKKHSLDKRLRHLIGAITDAVFVVDDDGVILAHNDAAMQLADSADPLDGKDFSRMLPLHGRTDIKAKRVDLLGDSSSPAPQHRRDLRLVTGSGATVDLDVTIRAVPSLTDTKDRKGQPLSDYVIVCEDITRERTMDEQRGEFIAVASHELRTPIAILEASLAIAKHSTEPMSDQIRMLLDQAHDSALYLSRIVKDLTTLRETADYNLPVQVEKINVQTMASRLVEDFKLQARQKGLDMTLDVDPGTPAVMSTEWHIREILQNYLTNALKYTRHGSVALRLSPTKVGGVLFCVADTGIGLSPADQKQLFIKFFRAEDYRTQATGGSGLGLYLSQELANRIGARVWCRSELNEGSEFYLEIPPSHMMEAVSAAEANKD